MGRRLRPTSMIPKSAAWASRKRKSIDWAFSEFRAWEGLMMRELSWPLIVRKKARERGEHNQAYHFDGSEGRGDAWWPWEGTEYFELGSFFLVVRDAGESAALALVTRRLEAGIKAEPPDSDPPELHHISTSQVLDVWPHFSLSIAQPTSSPFLLPPVIFWVPQTPHCMYNRGILGGLCILSLLSPFHSGVYQFSKEDGSLFSTVRR